MDIYFEVDDAKFLHELKETESHIDKLLDAIALDLARNAASEGGSVQPALGERWEIEGRSSPISRKVVAPEWWAHFFAHGTRDHGPSGAGKLAFTVEGQDVFADFVRGIPANPFDERAMARTRSHLPELMRRALA